MKRHLLISICALIAASAGFAAPAAAGTLTYDFTLDNCSSGCGLADYGSATVSDISGGGVTVAVALLGGSGFISSGALKTEQLIFNLSGSPNITIANLPTGWTYTQASFTPNGPFGTFDEELQCNSTCSPSTPWTNASGGGTDALDFTISTTSITTESFISGGTADDAFFAGDISNPNGGNALTGRIGAVDPPPTTRVPEPFTLSLFGAGLAGAVAMRRRKKA